MILPTAAPFSRGDRFKLWDSWRNIGFAYDPETSTIPEGATTHDILLLGTGDPNEAIEVEWLENYNMVDVNDPRKVFIYRVFRWT